MERTLAASIVLLTATACGSHPNDVGPGDVIGPGLCSAETVTDPLRDWVTCSITENANPDTPCECEDYRGAYPEGVYDPPTAAVLNVDGAYPGAKIDEDDFPGTMVGCSAYTRYAMPDCTTLAETSGVVVTAPETAEDVDFQDGDYTFNICPIRETMRPHPFETSFPMELRGTGSFDDKFSGRIHVEIQLCRYNDSQYHIKEPDWPTAQWIDPSPHRTDLVSASGDWLWDSFHSDEGGGWTEIHEARGLAVARPVGPLVSYLFVNSFFAEQTLQRDEVAVDIKVPAPQVNPTQNTFLDCYIPDAVAEERPDPKNPGATIPASQDPTVVNQCDAFNFGNGTGNAVNSMLFAPEPDSVAGVCRFKARATDESPRFGFNCQGTCDVGNFNPRDCNKLAASVAIRAEWRDPGDTWVCENCECADPSALGALISAPVQGCAQGGLNPSNPADQAIACAQVCGGTMCGAAPSCRIGSCSTQSSGSVARLIGRSTCDPTTLVPPGRVAPAGDYRATLDSSRSWVRVIIDDDEIQRPALGTFHFNINGDVLDFASSRVDVSQFSIRGKTVTEGRAFTVQRMFGHAMADNKFYVPAGIGVFGARALLDGTPKGINVTNPQPLFGTVDVANKTFELDIDGTSPDAPDQRLIAHLVGTIDNLPPTANAGPNERTVECTSPTTTAVTLSGTASRDPDTGDRITHYQWFNGDTAAGLGNTSTITAKLQLGLAHIVLHVYDQLLGSGSTVVRVNVVDTTPPELTLQPTEICAWPPDHKRIRLHLGDEIRASVHDVCDANPTIRVLSVTSSEPDDGIADGNTQGDVTFSGSTICVRRERSAFGPGRTYTAEVEASDASGNRVRQTVHIRVPQNSEPGCNGRFSTISDDAPCI